MNRHYKCFLTFIILLVAISLQAQSPEKRIHNCEQLWFGFFSQARLSNKWGLWTDIHYRMTDNFVGRPFHFLFRPAITYFLGGNLRLNIGYAYIYHFPANGFNTGRNEHRPWQQIAWSQKHPGLTTLQWLRLEQRFNEKVVEDFRGDSYNYNFRVRYNLAFFMPLKGKEIAVGTPFAAIMNELFLNFADPIVYNTFDQNRFFAGFGYQFSPHLNAQLGYMNVYQQESSGNNYLSTHTIRIFVFHSLDLRNDD